MSYIVSFTPEAKKVLSKIKKSNQRLWKKTEKILHELVETPKTGTGHPEPLKGAMRLHTLDDYLRMTE